MALKEIDLQQFRGRESLKLPLGPTNRISGMNGVGKTTIREAICFAFTGTDSAGNRNPQHLISRGQDGTKVEVMTDKSTISRSLSRKGNGTLKVIKNGVPTTYTQTQLEAMIGSTDLFLSAFIPGFFLKLTTERQHKVISEVLAKINREEILEELAGIKLTSEEKLRYSLARRADLVASQVAGDRREVEKTIFQLQGERTGLQSIKPVAEPQAPSEIASMSRLEALKDRWTAYERAIQTYNQTSIHYSVMQQRNKELDSRRDALKKELAVLVEAPLPKLEIQNEQITALRDQIKLYPAKPAAGTVVELDNCPTCGQAVGIKHREGVKAKNQAALDQHEKVCAELKAFNTELNSKIEALTWDMKRQNDVFQKTIEENKRITARKHAIELELAKLREEALPQVGDQPVAPDEVFDQAEYNRASQIVSDYNRSKHNYEYVQSQLKQSSARVKEIEDQIAEMQKAVTRLSSIEEALKSLPKEELRRQASFLQIDGVTFEIGESIQVLAEGTPYELLSAGQTMKTDVKVCLKLNSLMPRPINMVFLDNADLVDQMNWPESIQWFAAHVVAGQKEMVVTQCPISE